MSAQEILKALDLAKVESAEEGENILTLKWNNGVTIVFKNDNGKITLTKL
tara:strand:+ start:342 stop:491 length:150 start_codon:yes stop_codon:yes gene_type:complete